MRDFSLLSGPHRQRALDILRRQAFRPLWLIGSLAALGEVAHDPRLIAGLGEHTSICLSTLANASAALFTALFVMRFRRPIAHLIRNQPLERRLKRRSLHDLVQLVGSLWFVPVLVLVGISCSPPSFPPATAVRRCAGRWSARCWRWWR